MHTNNDNMHKYFDSHLGKRSLILKKKSCPVAIPRKKLKTQSQVTRSKKKCMSKEFQWNLKCQQ